MRTVISPVSIQAYIISASRVRMNDTISIEFSIFSF